MTLLSYGEDALTLWALTKGLGSILTQLGDLTTPNQALILYRPSFGRRNGFGEFDAIIGTSCAVYLVETKWSTSARLNGKIIPAAQEQRHKILSWYLDKWNTSNPNNWASFKRLYAALYSQQFSHPSFPDVGSVLACNLEFVLRQLSNYGGSIEHVLLFIGPNQKIQPPPNFRLIALSPPTTIGDSGYFYL